MRDGNATRFAVSKTSGSRKKSVTLISRSSKAPGPPRTLFSEAPSIVRDSPTSVPPCGGSAAAKWLAVYIARNRRRYDCAAAGAAGAASYPRPQVRLPLSLSAAPEWLSRPIPRQFGAGKERNPPRRRKWRSSAYYRTWRYRSEQKLFHPRSEERRVGKECRSR